MYLVSELFGALLYGSPAILLGVLFFFGWKHIGRWLVPIVAVQILLQGFSVWAEDTKMYTAQGLRVPGLLAVWLIPDLTVLVAARLMDVRHPENGRVTWPRGLLSFIALVILLGMLGVQIILGSIWDVATDGLTGPVLVFIARGAGIYGAILLALKLPGNWKTAGLAFLVVVAAGVNSAKDLGTTDPDGKWGQLPHIMTEARAERINIALLRYHAETGSYPAALADLTPRYLVYLPNPYIIPGQTWCYESGADYYRLGYINRDYFSSPQEVTIFASGGVMPEPDSICP